MQLGFLFNVYTPRVTALLRLRGTVQYRKIPRRAVHQQYDPSARRDLSPDHSVGTRTIRRHIFDLSLVCIKLYGISKRYRDLRLYGQCALSGIE